MTISVISQLHPIRSDPSIGDQPTDISWWRGVSSGGQFDTEINMIILDVNRQNYSMAGK